MFALFEDRQAPLGEPAAWRFDEFVELREPCSLAELRQSLEVFAQDGLWTVACLHYELGASFEPAVGQPATDAPLARFWRFRHRTTLSAEEVDALLAETSPVERVAGIAEVRPLVYENAYLAAVDRIKAWIAAGDCYQVNFTFPLHFSWFGSAFALYARLRERQPVRYGGVIVQPDGSGIVSLSPELFVQKQGRRLVTRPMKGTAPRDTSPALLLASEKNRAENLMIVDLLRNDLGRIAALGSVKVEHLFEIEPYPSVWQMVSQISAELSETLSAQDSFSILKALFPCGSITGAPKVRAMQIIQALEAFPRGAYCGALGWISPTQDFRFNVPIRTLTLQANGEGRMGVGSGIVADSEGLDEWRECLLKARFLTDLDPGFRLIETLKAEDGQFPLREVHWARLSASAKCFGFAVDREKFDELLASVPKNGTYRVRLTLDKAGQWGLTQAPLDVTPLHAWAAMASKPIDAGYFLRRHKTTDRHIYDEALAHLPSGFFDYVFLNERGEVAEGARSTVFVEREGRLLTPPVHSGALPGVLRASLLAQGRAQESILYPEDLAAGFYLGNALRGLVAVQIKTPT